MNLKNWISKKKGFKIGDKVEHTKFGDGIVIEKTENGSFVKLEIDFKKVGVKKILSNLTNVLKKK